MIINEQSSILGKGIKGMKPYREDSSIVTRRQEIYMIDSETGLSLS